jgi:multisubunit Na+/H+ antiporter MnhB subunit
LKFLIGYERNYGKTQGRVETVGLVLLVVVGEWAWRREKGGEARSENKNLVLSVYYKSVFLI